MGDIADMILEGLLDEETGEYIGDRNVEEYGMEAPGFPVTYNDDSDDDISFDIPFIDDQPKKHACPICSRKISIVGLFDHIEKRHGPVKSVTYELDDGSRVVARRKKWSFYGPK